MPVGGELERAELLGICFLASAVRKLIRQYEARKTATPNKTVVEKARSLLGMVMVGSLDFPKEDKERLLPNGAGLYESVRAYSYARQIWSHDEFRGRAPQNHKDLLDKIRTYVHTIEVLGEGRAGQELTPADPLVLQELSTFMLHLEDRLLGELNSVREGTVSRI